MEKSLENLEIYNLSSELSKKTWDIFTSWDYSTKKLIWDQFMRSVDSVWWNIAEWYGRYHYLDSIRFYYNARWSLFESRHRLGLLHDRGLMSKEDYIQLYDLMDCIIKKLNNFIASIRKQATTNKPIPSSQ